MNPALFGIAAISGLASATLMLAVGSGSPVAILLFMFTPLPLLLAGLGWGHRAAGIGAVVGALVVGLAAGWDGARGYALAAGLPGWLLSLVALWPRPARDDPATVRWASPGALVLWAAALGALLVVATIPFLGTTLAAYRGALEDAFKAFLRAQTGTPDGAAIVLPGGGDPGEMVSLFAIALPPIGAAGWMLALLLNLWLAARIARTSGRLARPWPPIPTLSLPMHALPAVAVALALSFTPGLVAVVGEVCAAVLVVALAIVGLAVIHAGTRGSRGRVFILIGVYLMLFVQVWTGLFLALLGLVEQTVGLRHRFAPRAGPPPRP